MADTDRRRFRPAAEGLDVARLGWAAGALVLTVLSTEASAQRLGRCGFDPVRLTLAGSAVEKARCLISPVLVGVPAGDHDDPQNFGRAAFEGAHERRLATLKGSASTEARGSPALSTGTALPLRVSLYYTALQRDYPAGEQVALRTRNGTLIARVSQAFARKAEIEGSAKLNDGRVINVDGRVSGTRRWKHIPQAFGLDAVGCGLVPFRSAAVDRSVVPLRTRLHLPETVGMRMPDGTRHDGIWYAVDTGSAIVGNRIDIFLGAGQASMAAPRAHGIGHLQPLAATRLGRFTGCPPT